MTTRIAFVTSRLDVWLVAAVALGAWLRFSRLGDFDNQYYTATVVSMLQSPANFLFGSFDPGGVVMVDKPPLSFWVQAIPVALFGPSRWAVVLPQAVAGTLAILILYLAVRPAFGRVAAAASALVLAVVPASVVIDSRNEPDSLLSFALLLAAVSVMQAAKTGKWRWLITFAMLMGVAFNIKMLVAFVPLPAFLLYYVLASKQPVRRVAIRTAASVGLLLVVAFSWATVVAITPAEQRPYVGSTRDNSIWTLVFKYNGLNRFTSFIGPRPGPAGAQPPQGVQQGVVPGQGPGYSPPPGGAQPQQPPPAPAARGLGLLSLFTERLAGQTGWLLPLGLFMLLVAVVPLLAEKVYQRPAALLDLLRESPAASQTVLWAGWFATAVLVFGLASSTTTHPYYLVGLAVPLATVIGVGFHLLWRTYRETRALAWLLPVAVVGAALYQVLSARGVVADWAAALVLVLMPVAALGLAVGAWKRVVASPLAGAFVVLGAIAVLVVPAASAINTGGPIAGPAARQAMPPGPAGASPEGERVGQVSSFLRQQGDAGSVFVVGTVSAREAAPFIIAGVPAVAIGGFSGNDPIFNIRSFRAMVERGELRYFLMPGSTPPAGPGGGQPQEAILREIRQTWEDVSAAARMLPGTLYRFRG
ncbi:MAG: glycosyltransferase family 39 protein [Dehalococcoidia bacterium]|nr:glycosyltransferase family 39 protein [Dehalococcoidia bacterium]